MHYHYRYQFQGVKQRVVKDRGLVKVANKTIPAEGEVVWQENWHSVKLQMTAINHIAVKSVQVASA